MVTLNTLLIVSVIVGIGASVGTVAFLLLLGTYLSTRNKKEEQGQYTLPMLPGMRNITQADVDQARMAFAQHRTAGPPEDKKEYVPPEGSYI